jgi:hypothetical protein
VDFALLQSHTGHSPAHFRHTVITKDNHLFHVHLVHFVPFDRNNLLLDGEYKTSGLLHLTHHHACNDWFGAASKMMTLAIDLNDVSFEVNSIDVGVVNGLVVQMNYALTTT